MSGLIGGASIKSGIVASACHSGKAGLILQDDCELGFGDGANGRPDFGIAGNSSNLNFYCGEGGNDVDVSMNTSGMLGVGCAPSTYGLKVDGTGNSGLFTGGVVSCGSFENRSDERLKDNITPLGNTLDIVNKLKPVTYNLKREEFSEEDFAGFIAQEVKKIFPIAVRGDEDEKEDVLDKNGKVTGQQPVYMGIKIMDMIALLSKSIQELSAKNDALELENTELKTKLDALEARVTALEG